MKQKIKSWQDITVAQFIELNLLSQQVGGEDLEKAERAIGIIYDLTPQQIDNLPVVQFNDLSRDAVAIMTSKIEGKPKKVIKGAKHRYKIEYDPRKITHRQFVELQFFSNNIMSNIHFILASIVRRVGRFGMLEKNTAENHESYAQDLMDAKIADVYGSCVFFCKLFLNSLVHIRGYLVHQMMTEGATKKQAMQLVNSTIDAMAGSITQKNWLLINV